MNQQYLIRQKVDHLFLLVGANPLPNWVVASLLLKERGTVYLVYSPETENVAKRLTILINKKYKKVWQTENGPCKNINIENAYDSLKINGILMEFINKLGVKPGESVGLNYTGGTKPMSVHGYRAIISAQKKSFANNKFICSYLDAENLTLHFDDSDFGIPVWAMPETQCSISDIMNLHEDYDTVPNNNSSAFEYSQIIVDICKSPKKAGSLRDWSEALRNYRHQIKNNTQIGSTIKLPDLPPELNEIAFFVSNGNLNIGDPEANKNGLQEFKSEEDFIDWLSGKWLEDYTLGTIKLLYEGCNLTDSGKNIIPLKKERLSRSNDEIISIEDSSSFEIDVAVTRGYQLFLFSCYMGGKKRASKLKLFESIIRARQIGGDAAAAALICLSSDPSSIELEVGLSMDLKNRIKVFGINELPSLEKYLRKWFNSFGEN